jgi:cytochrome oxidase Cu insertion factor (SCO1/SenC/PrrC family)
VRKTFALVARDSAPGAAGRALALCLLLAVGSVARAAADPMQPQAPSLDFVPPPAGSYRLQQIQQAPDAVVLDARGRQRRLASLTRGRVTLLTFFYTYCTDEWGCPFAYKTMVGLREQLMARGRADRVRFVSLSFDPTHDTPEALRLYSAHLHADRGLPWTFLTARSVPDLLPLLDDFGQDVRVERDERGRPTRTINHMLKLFLIDRRGIVREIYALDYLHPAMMVNDIETLLLEEADDGGRR